MALEDFLSTPSGYATPEQLAMAQHLQGLVQQSAPPPQSQYTMPDQLASQRQYADLLRKGATRDEPMTSPWQGARMMADALSGNIMSNRAGQQQMSNAARLGNVNTDASIQSQSMGVGPQASLGAQASLGGGLDPQTARTFKLESGGDPNNVTGSNRGLAQFSPDLEKKYGITDWHNPQQEAAATQRESAENAQGLAKALGRQPTPGEIYLAHQQGLAGATALLTNPNVPAWQAVRKFYPSDAIAQKAIAGNPPGGGHFDPNAPAGAFAGAWVKQFESRMPQQAAGGQTADLSGSIGGTSAQPIGSPQAMPGALAANAPRGPSPTTSPLPTQGMPQGNHLQPGVVPFRPRMTPEMLRRIETDPIMDPAQKEMYRQQFMMQFQPQQFQSDYGTTLIGPQGQQQFIGKPLTNTYESPGGGKAPIQYKYNPDGSLSEVPVNSGQAPAATPQEPPAIFKNFGPTQTPAQAPPKPQSALQPTGATAAAQASPMGQAGPTAASAPPSGAPTASAVPGNIASDAPPQGVPPSMLSSLPPGAQAAAGKPAPGGEQVAQNSALPGRAGQIMNELQQRGVDYAGQKTQAEDFAKASEVERTGISDVAKKSSGQMSQLQTALKLVDDPNFVSGIINTPGTFLQKARALLGSNPKAARAIETFDKIIAGATLPEVTSQTKGVGQVRLAEFNTVKDSLASRNLTPEGIKAVLGIMLAAHQQNIDVSNLASGFSQGWRIGPDGKPFNSGKQGLNDPAWQTTLNKFLENHPVITPEQKADWNKNFGSDFDQEVARRMAGEEGGPSQPAPKPKAGHPQPMATPAAGFNNAAPPPPPGFR